MGKKLFLLFLTPLLLCCQSSNNLYYVKEVIDGDSFRLKDGREVRLIGVNAPEGGQPGADISKNFLKLLIEGKKVRLKEDKLSQDENGRLLRYVFVNSIFVNAALIEEGYAEELSIFPNTLYQKRFEELEKKAFSNKKGLWAFGVFSRPLCAIAKENVICWRDAAKHYGEIRVVEGVVVDTYISDKACFLNFSTNYKKDFSVVIFSRDFLKFPPHLDKFYLGKKVRVSGLIKRYKSRPEIIVSSPHQITVID